MDTFLTIAASFAGVVLGALLTFLLTRRLNAEDEAKDRRKVLEALASQVDIAKGLCGTNKTASEEAKHGHVQPVQFPTAPFEAAFFSGHAFPISETTRRTALEYYNKAIELNAAISALRDVGFSKPYFDTTATWQFLNDQSISNMPEILGSLGQRLQEELKSARKE